MIPSVLYGSSPRLRGTLRVRRRERNPTRFIPAPAGNMYAPTVASTAKPVHPRACGEHACWSVGSWSTLGSSPRLRGTCSCSRSTTWTIRFIPAPAGNIVVRYCRRQLVPVHPRACGEHNRVRPWSMFTLGSSPRLRGTFVELDLLAFSNRFIPAPAGNMMCRFGVPDIRAVHPRACGEHWMKKHSTDGAAGSSPRLRGTWYPPAHVKHFFRFIPAPAGNIRPCLGSSRSAAVHPRACGEHARRQSPHRRQLGSSPRLRGTSGRGRSGQRRPRFIPAPAGNMPCCCKVKSISPVHPRACGEHEWAKMLEGLGNGSSPRLRGTSLTPKGNQLCLRFIPAPAGNIQAGNSNVCSTPVHPRACGEHVNPLGFFG